MQQPHLGLVPPVTGAATSLRPTPPVHPPRRHPKQVGDESQAMVLARLVQVYGSSASILVPFGENCRYDLVIDDGQKFTRVQCKTGRLRKGCVLFPTCSSTYHHPANRGTRLYARSYRDQADVFGVYCPETDVVYLVPVPDVGTRQGALRVEPTKNNQARKVRWARDYELNNLVKPMPG